MSLERHVGAPPEAPPLVSADAVLETIQASTLRVLEKTKKKFEERLEQSRRTLKAQEQEVGIVSGLLDVIGRAPSSLEKGLDEARKVTELRCRLLKASIERLTQEMKQRCEELKSIEEKLAKEREQKLEAVYRARELVGVNSATPAQIYAVLHEIRAEMKERQKGLLNEVVLQDQELERLRIISNATVEALGAARGGAQQPQQSQPQPPQPPQPQSQSGAPVQGPPSVGPPPHLQARQTGGAPSEVVIPVATLRPAGKRSGDRVEDNERGAKISRSDGSSEADSDDETDDSDYEELTDTKESEPPTPQPPSDAIMSQAMKLWMGQKQALAPASQDAVNQLCAVLRAGILQIKSKTVEYYERNSRFMSDDGKSHGPTSWGLIVIFAHLTRALRRCARSFNGRQKLGYSVLAEAISLLKKAYKASSLGTCTTFARLVGLALCHSSVLGKTGGYQRFYCSITEGLYRQNCVLFDWPPFMTLDVVHMIRPNQTARANCD